MSSLLDQSFMRLSERRAYKKVPNLNHHIAAAFPTMGYSIIIIYCHEINRLSEDSCLTSLL